MGKVLSQEQASVLRDALASRYQAVLSQVQAAVRAAHGMEYDDLIGQVRDAGDESVADVLMDLQLAELDRHLQELKDIERAQDKLQNGTYGRCEDCREPIAFPRLRAWPAARRCLPCQDRYERSGPSIGGNGAISVINRRY